MHDPIHWLALKLLRELCGEFAVVQRPLHEPLPQFAADQLFLGIVGLAAAAVCSAALYCNIILRQGNQFEERNADVASRT